MLTIDRTSSVLKTRFSLLSEVTAWRGGGR